MTSGPTHPNPDPGEKQHPSDRFPKSVVQKLWADVAERLLEAEAKQLHLKSRLKAAEPDRRVHSEEVFQLAEEFRYLDLPSDTRITPQKTIC